MFCKKCGAEMQNDATFCPKCGSPVNGEMPQQDPYAQPAPASSVVAASSSDAPSGGFAFLCFLWPILGLILYLVWHQQYPLKAHSCAKGAAIGVIVYMLSFVLCVVLVFSIGLSALNALPLNL